MKKNDVFSVMILGAGAGGLAAGISALRSGASVLLLEHTEEAGKKLLLTGNGHCNLSNRRLSKEHYFGDEAFLESVPGLFDPGFDDLFFGSLSILLRTRHYGYDESLPVYPEHMSARGVRDALLYEYLGLGGILKTGIHAEEVLRTEEGFMIRAGERTFRAARLILACGSNAAPSTGSDSSCYPFVKALGHSFRTFLPALCALKTQDPLLKCLAGERHVCRLTDLPSGRTFYGEVQFNDGSLSGIPVLNLSAFLAHTAGKDLKGRELQADLFPDQTEEALLSYLREAGERSRRLHTGVRELLGAGIGDRTAAFLEQAGALSGKDGFSAGPAAALLKYYRFRITGTDGFQRCQACAGGIPTDEVKPESMESRIVPGLYTAGELLDVLGECGGYNLHFAFASGIRVGEKC